MDPFTSPSSSPVPDTDSLFSVFDEESHCPDELADSLSFPVESDEVTRLDVSCLSDDIEGMIL